MKKLLRRSACCAALLAALPLTGNATVFFSDTFSDGSSLNSLTPAAPTTNSTSYQLSSSKSRNPTPVLSANNLKYGIASTTSGAIEMQALFTTNPVALVLPGDYISLTVTFTNVAGLQTANCQVGFGLYNGGQVQPIAGGLNGTAVNTSSDKAFGGVQNWKGYWGQRGFTGQDSRIVSRLEQTSGTDNRNQNLTSTGSSSMSYGNPGGATVGTASTAPSGPLTVGNTYTVVLRIDLVEGNGLAITNTYYDGTTTNGTVVSQFGCLTTTPFTTSFDGMAVGWRAGASSTGGTVISISSILVDGSVTAVTAPPDILTQPVPVIVPAGGSCRFSVAAQGFGMSYQWHRYGTNLVDGGNISGAKTPNLIISPANAADVASGANGYYVTVSGVGGFNTNSTTVSLTLGTASSLVWSGTAGSTWDLGTTVNWLKGSSPATFNYGDAVTFDDTPGAEQLVELSGSYLAAASVTVNNSIPYTFTGSGNFAGPGSLLYKGAGLLTINNANTHTGGTIISNAAAWMVLNNYSGLGSGPLILAKAGGTLEIATAGGAANGIKGDVIVQDNFTIQCDTFGAYAGVFLGNLGGTAGKTLTLKPTSTANSSRIRTYGSATVCDANLVLEGISTMEAAYYGTVLAPYHSTGNQIYNGVISGAGGIIQRAGGLTVLAGQNTYAGGTTPTTGTIGFGANSTGNVDSGPIGTGPLFINPEAPGLTGSGTVLAFGGARTIANPLQYSSGTNNQTLVIGGTNDLTFTGPYTLNGNDFTTTYTSRVLQVNNSGLTTLAGPISGDGFGLVKAGTGRLVLSGNNTYTGPTQVTNGTLLVNSSLPGAVAVTAAGVLGGTGTINGAVTLGAGTTLAPGASVGTLTINNDLTLAGNLAVEINKSLSPNSDRVVVSGALANTGTGTITVTNLGPALAANDSFALFNKAVTGAAGLTITGGNAIWTNKLAIDGTIAVLTPISQIPTDIGYSIAAGNLTLSWPLDHLTWILQSNSVSVANSSAWYAVPGSQTNTQMTFPIIPSRTNVFYRLVKP